MHVIVHGYRNMESTHRIVAELRQCGMVADPASFDVRNYAECASACTDLLTCGPIQILVNNAGLHDDAPLAGMSMNQWYDVLNVSLNGFFNVTKPLLLPMIRTRWGRIVNVTSVAAVIGTRGQTNYVAAKAGLNGLTKSLAREVASRGITVNAVAPGVIDGGMARTILTNDFIKAMVPMKRAGTATEVAALVGFLVSEEASYITGQSIGINGGMA